MGGGREEENVTGTKIREIEREKKKRKKKQCIAYRTACAMA